MRKRLWKRGLLAAMLFGATIVPATSQAAELTTEQINAIVERLEQAEKEIEQLRGQVAPQPAAYQLAADPAVLPNGSGSRVTPMPVSYLDDDLKAPGAADEADSDVLDRLAALEDQWKEFDADAQLERFDGYDDEFKSIAKFHKTGVVIPGTSNTTMKLFGRIHLDAWTYPDDDGGVRIIENGTDDTVQDRFTFRRIRLGAKGNINTNMFYKFESEFADPNDFEFRDVYVGFKDVPVFNTILIGNHKRPFGLDHLNSSRYNVFIERPFVIEAFNEDARRLGISSNGVSDDQQYNWRFGIFNLERIQNDGEFRGDSWQPQVAGRFAHTYWWDEASGGRGYAHWAISGAIADPDETGGIENSNEARFRTRPEARTLSRWLNTGRIADVEHFSILGLEHVYNYGPFQWVTELQGNYVNRSTRDATFWGGYTYVSYFLTPGDYMTWDRKTGTLGRIKPYEDYFTVQDCDGCRQSAWGAWQVAARYSYLDLNDKDIFGGVGEAFTLSLVWYWNQNASVQFNYIHGSIENAALSDGNPAAVQQSGDYDILGMRMRVDF